MEGTTGREVTYPQLTDQVAKVGSALVKQGLKPGDVVTLFSPNLPEFAVMYLAVAAIGGIVSAVNPLYTVGEWPFWPLDCVVCFKGKKGTSIYL